MIGGFFSSLLGRWIPQLRHNLLEFLKSCLDGKEILPVLPRVGGNLRLLIEDELHRVFHFFVSHIELPSTQRYT